MSLRSKMLAMSALPVVILVLAFVLAVVARNAATRANHEVDRMNEVRVMLAQIQDDLTAAESGVRGYLLTGREGFLVEQDVALVAFHRHVEVLDPLLEESVQRIRLDRLRELADERVQTLEEVTGLAGAPSAEAQARLDTWLMHGATISRTLRFLTTQMEETAQQVEAAGTASRDAAYQRSYLVQMVGMPASIAIAMLLLYGFAAGIVRRIQVMRANAERLDAGVTTQESDPSKDELGELSRAWARTGTNLVDLQEELRRLATIDPLTGLANRRGFFALAEHTLLVAARTRCAVALLFLDTDGLKNVNDALGHSVGDALLAETADVIRETIRGSDIAGRIGGDEFCVLLVGDPELDHERVIKRLRETEASHNARPGRQFTVSTSIGVTALAPGRSVTLEELIDAADEGMYEDKRDRRDSEPVRSA